MLAAIVRHCTMALATQFGLDKQAGRSCKQRFLMAKKDSHFRVLPGSWWRSVR